MSKEVIRPHQFAHAEPLEEDLILNEDQHDGLASLYSDLSHVRAGQLVTGTVLSVSNDGVLLDINYKSNGLIPLYEFSEHELKKIKSGSALEVILDELEGPSGVVVLSYEKAKETKAWDHITKLFNEAKPVEGVVTHKVKGGLSVDIGIPAFLPGSQVDIHRVADFDQFVGQTIIADILKLNRKRGNVILSRRKYLTTLRTESRKKILETVEVGAVVQGVVKNITNYGAFVDIGGVDGLLHITDMTWGRIAHPTELVKIGQTITTKILSIDKDNAKISLGMKQLAENPWDQATEKLTVGSRVKGTIASITDYGLFVELMKGVEGLVHISEVSWVDRISDLKKQFKVGDTVEVVIVSIDKENRRMSLSIKQLEKNPWEVVSTEFKVGQRVKGTISNITDFGMFVTLKPGIDGLVHISDLSWTEHVNHPADVYQRGQEVEVAILAIDEANKKISLGIKQLSQDPWEAIETEYPKGMMVEGIVAKIAPFGAFIKLPSGIEGLVHISELSDQEVAKVEDILTVGQKMTFRVINANKDERKLGLSLRAEGSESTVRRPKKEAAPRVERRQQEEKPKSQLQTELERLINERKSE